MISFVFTTRGSKLGDPVFSCSLSVQEPLTGVSKTPYLSSGVMISFVFTTRGSKLGDPVSSCSFSVQEPLTGEQTLIRFRV